MLQQTDSSARHSTAYNVFILVLTVFSLVIMVVMFLPLSDATIVLLQVYDNLICAIFLLDFLLNLRAAPKKSDYFIKERGWLDLLGSIPSLGATFKYTGILRLARLSRLARISRLMRNENRASLLKDIAENRSQYTAFVTVLLTLIILATASVLVLQFESKSPDAKIVTGGEALWYSIVTITTVGYGDYFPVTHGGRITAFFIMVAGVGLIGVLASLMSSLVMGSNTADEEADGGGSGLADLAGEIADLKQEMASLRRFLEESTSNDSRQ